MLLPTEVVGGHEHMLLEWLATAAEEGLGVVLYCPPRGEMSALATDAGFEVRDLFAGSRPAGRGTFAKVHRFVRVYRAVGRLERDCPVLLAPGAMQSSPGILAACALQRRKTVCYVPMAFDSTTVAGKPRPWRDRMVRLLASRVLLWVVINERQRRLLDDVWRIKCPIVTIPNRLKVMSDARQEGKPVDTGVLRVLYLGRFEAWQKGLDWFVEFVRSTAGAMPDVTFTFQGRGWFRAELERLQNDRADLLVRILPWGDPAAALRNADVLVLTSRFEGFPLVAVQAICAGVPVVATVESGLETILAPGCTFSFGDAPGLRSALDAMRDQANRDAALAYARARLEAILSPSTYQDQVRQAVAAIERLYVTPC